MTVRIVRIPLDPSKPTETVEIPDDLASFQEEVGGGYIEIVRITPYVHMFVDEDGIAKNLVPNVRATVLAGQVILGDVFLSGDDPTMMDGEEHDVPLGTQELLDRFFGMVEYPEVVVG